MFNLWLRDPSWDPSWDPKMDRIGDVDPPLVGSNDMSWRRSSYMAINQLAYLTAGGPISRSRLWPPQFCVIYKSLENRAAKSPLWAGIMGWNGGFSQSQLRLRYMDVYGSFGCIHTCQTRVSVATNSNYWKSNGRVAGVQPRHLVFRSSWCLSIRFHCWPISKSKCQMAP